MNHSRLPWEFIDVPACLHRYGVMERRDEEHTTLICSTPWVNEQAKADMEHIAALHNDFLLAERDKRVAADEAQPLDEGAPTNAAYRIWNDLAEFIAFIGPAENKYKAIAVIQGRIVEMLNNKGVTQAAQPAERDQEVILRRALAETLTAAVALLKVIDHYRFHGEASRILAESGVQINWQGRAEAAIGAQLPLPQSLWLEA